MQRCNSCGATWTVKQPVETCPFCGANLSENTTVSSIEGAFSLILEKHGQAALQSNILIGLLGDYAPMLKRERNLAKIAVESGAYRAICEAPISEKENTTKKYIAILTDSYFIDENWAKKALYWCLNAIAPNLSAIPQTSSSSTLEETLVNAEKASIPTLSALPKTNIGHDFKKYLGNDRVIAIPDGVTKIADHAFYGNEKLTEVIIPPSVKIIGKSAFAYCTALQTVQIDSGVEIIEDWAFVNCLALNRIALPDSIRVIGELAFQGCSQLEVIDLPPFLTEISERTFADCIQLKDIKMPKHLNIISKEAFDNCRDLKIIALPSDTNIDVNAFGRYGTKPKIVFFD